MNDPHDNEADDRAMLRKLRDQENTMDNDEQRDYAEEQYNRHLLDDERDPDEFEILVTRDSRGFQISAAALRQAADSGSAVIRFTAPDGFRFGDDRRLHPDTSEDPEGERDTPRLDETLDQVPPWPAMHLAGPLGSRRAEDDMFRRYSGGSEPATRSRHRTAAMHLAGMAGRSDPEFVPGLGFAALTHAVLALSADREPDGTWRRRAVEAEAALTAIGGILVSENGIVRKAELISGVLRTSGRNAKGFTVHTGMLAHDGFMPHSHEVRPDHYSVPRERP